MCAFDPLRARQGSKRIGNTQFSMTLKRSEYYYSESATMTAVKQKMRQVRSQLIDQFLAFKPSIETFQIKHKDMRFFCATPQAAEWYKPLPKHLISEFEWVAERLDGQSDHIVDAGAYHGLYSIVLGTHAHPDSTLVAVDPVPSNCAIIEANFALNRISGSIIQAAVATEDAPVSFTANSCGRIEKNGTLSYKGMQLSSIMRSATVAKIDIEGAEAAVLPAQIDDMTDVHTWIVELHPDFGVDASAILKLFVDRDFKLEYLDRDQAKVMLLDPSKNWSGRTAFMATR